MKTEKTLKVVQAYESNIYPMEGNLCVELLVLSDGRHVALDYIDYIFQDWDEVSEYYSGEFYENPKLLDLWKDGYEFVEGTYRYSTDDPD